MDKGIERKEMSYMTFKQREERMKPHIEDNTVLQVVGYNSKGKMMDRMVFSFCDEETLLDHLQFVYRLRYQRVDIQRFIPKVNRMITTISLRRDQFTMKNAWQNARKALDYVK